jgi:hypothetical protein
VYLLVTWTVNSLFYFLIIKSAGANAASGAYTTRLMWCPAIGALLIMALAVRLAEMKWRRERLERLLVFMNSPKP